MYSFGGPVTYHSTLNADGQVVHDDDPNNTTVSDYFAVAVDNLE